MNALKNIQNEDKQIVEQLADRQINSMKVKYNEFKKWMAKLISMNFCNGNVNTEHNHHIKFRMF